MRLPLLETKHAVPALGLASGVLLVIACRVPGAWALSFIALVPLFMAVARAASGKQAFLAGLLAGIPLMGAALWWLFDALPLPPAFGDITPALGLATVGISFAILTLAFGTLAGGWTLFAYAIRQWRFGLVAAAVAWLAFEYLRMVAYNLFTFAPQVHNPPFFSAGFVGYPLADSVGWLQLAVFGGVYALGLAVVLGNLVAYRILRTPRRRFLLAASFVATIAAAHFAPIASVMELLRDEAPRRTITVAALSLRTPANADPAVRAPAEATMLDFVRQASAAGADLVALTEESNLFAPFSERTPYGSIGGRNRTAVVDSGTVLLEDGTRVRRAIAADTLGIDSGLLQDKRILTPKGEYLPTLLSSAFTAFGGGKHLDRFAAKRSYSLGTYGSPGTVAGVRISVLLCIEAMQPGLGRAVVREQESDVITILASHAWFGVSPPLAQDTYRQARVQAVEAGVPVVRSADFAPAYVFDRYGRVVASGGFGEEPGMAVATLKIP
jgi:apolipoprotein N-acyltransferase